MNRFLHTRFPTVFGLVILLIGLGLIGILTKNGVVFQGNAAAGETPQDIRITNVTDTSFTVSFMTSEAVLGTISYGTDANLGTVILDDRDQTASSPSPHKSHYITLSRLKPNTTYFFSIISGKTTYLQNNAPFQVKTADTITTRAPTLPQISGTLLVPEGETSGETIIYASNPDSQPLSTLARPDKSYVVDLTNLRTADLKTFALFKSATTLNLLFVAPSGKSSVTLFANQSSPLPAITISKNYDFTLNSKPLIEQSSPSGTLNTAFPLFTANETVKESPKVNTPSQNESFTDQKPQFQGTALPNEKVTIEIHSDSTIKTAVTSDANGRWTYRPTTALTPGKHTITVTTRTSTGILQSITRSFTVFAQGSQFIEPSVAPRVTTPTKTPTPVASSKPTSAPTASPTKAPTATPTSRPTATPTAKPTATPTKIPTPTPTKKLVALAQSTPTPTMTPTPSPTKIPTPTTAPSLTPTPTRVPTLTPTRIPTPTKTLIASNATELPPTGNSVFLGVIISTIAIGIGLSLALLAKSSSPL